MAIWIDWAILGSCFVLAIFIGLFVKKFKRTTIALLGAAGGVAIGFLITTATLLHNGWAYYLILIAAGLVGALLTVWLAEWIIMIASAFFGSYLAVRGVSFYAGGFPNEFDIKAYIEAGISKKSFPPEFYGYLGGIVAMFILTLAFQCCRHKAIKQKKAEAEARIRKDKRIDHIERFGSDI